MKSPKEILKKVILPFVIMDVMIVVAVLYLPIDEYLSRNILRAFTHSLDDIQLILGFVIHVGLPYFLFWAVIYAIFGFLYHKFPKWYVICLFGVPMMLLKLAYLLVGLMYLQIM